MLYYLALLLLVTDVRHQEINTYISVDITYYDGQLGKLCDSKLSLV